MSIFTSIFKSLKMQVILKRLGRTVAYTAITMLIGYLTIGLETFIPDGVTQEVIWKLLLIPLITGIIAGLDKLRRWKP